jgi:hypothetical protein
VGFAHQEMPMKPQLKLVKDSAPQTTTPTQRQRKPSARRLGVVEQVRLASQREHRLAGLCGFLLGGFVPLATYVVSHVEYDRAQAWYAQMATLLILGGLLYSARTVYDWGKLAFSVPAKAAGFVLLLEGVMTFSASHWLGVAALVYLMVINGVATATRLVLQ